MKLELAILRFVIASGYGLFAVSATASPPSTGATAAPSRAPRSIAELAVFSNVLIHHYECTADLLLSPGSLNREVVFNVSPLVKGESGSSQTLQARGDKLVTSANGQMLSLQWTRLGRVIADVRTMIIDSPTRSYVLIAIDPAQSDQQVQVVCNAFTFAEFAAQNLPKTPVAK